MDLTKFASKSTLRLSTIGRKSGKTFTVTIWFVVDGPTRLFVQHVTAPANWCRNLAKTPTVELDFGEGPLRATATVIEDAGGKQDVLARFRRKYFSARFIQFFGRRHNPFVARIDIANNS